jgi:hypothetical protein
MNKAIVSIVIACGLLVLQTPEAAAHEARHAVHRPSAHHRADNHYREHRHRDHRHATTRRASSMPRWLKEDRSFRHWYKTTRLQRNLYLSWYELFDIYRWEHSHYRPDYRRYRH